MYRDSHGFLWGTRERSFYDNRLCQEPGPVAGGGSTANKFCKKNGRLLHFALFFAPPEKLPDPKIDGGARILPSNPLKNRRISGVESEGLPRFEGIATLV